jgi:hypothetical protein
LHKPYQHNNPGRRVYRQLCVLRLDFLADNQHSGQSKSGGSGRGVGRRLAEWLQRSYQLHYIGAITKGEYGLVSVQTNMKEFL